MPKLTQNMFDLQALKYHICYKQFQSLFNSLLISINHSLIHILATSCFFFSPILTYFGDKGLKYIPVLGNFEWTKVNTLHVLPWFSAVFFKLKINHKMTQKAIQVNKLLNFFLLAVLNVISFFFFFQFIWVPFCSS